MIGTSAADGASTSDDGFERVARVSDVPEGGLLGLRLSSGERVCLYRLGERLGAVSDICTHQEFEISLGTLLPDGTVECAWHGAVFDCATGAVRKGPAVDPLPVFTVRVEGGDVLVRTARL